MGPGLRALITCSESLRHIYCSDASFPSALLYLTCLLSLQYIMPGVHNGLGGTMAPPLDNNITVPATVASQAPGYNNHHRQHSERLFIGPMLFTAAEGHLGPKDSGGFIKHWFPRRHDMTSSDNINEEISERHAFQYFLRRGGTEQDWESQESVRQR